MSWRKDFEINLQNQYIEKADGKLRAYRKRMRLREELLKPKKKKVTPKTRLMQCYSNKLIMNVINE